MPIPLGVLAVAGAGGGVVAGNAYEWLETVTVGTAVASISFSNVNTNYGSTYQHLQVRGVARGTRGISVDGLTMRLNSDTGNNYASHNLVGNGSTVTSTALANGNQMELTTLTAATATANTFGGFVLDILDAFETTKYKTIRVLGGHASTANYISLDSGLWRNTNAITTILFDTAGASTNFEVGTRISLYGLRSA